MFNSLLYLGLCASAFFIFPGTDLREVKMTMAVLFALALGMAEIYTHGIKANKNIWIVLFVAYIPISIMFAPPPLIDLQGIPVANFWSWYPFIKILIFSVLFFVISGHPFKAREIKNVLNVMVWCGFLTALYEISQLFYTDQFFRQCADGDWGRIAGFIGNPTLTAPFVAMLIPIAFFLRKYIMATIMLIGVIIPDSQMAWIALAAGLVTYFSLKGPRWFVTFLTIGIAGLILYFILFNFGLHSSNKYLRSLFEDHERFIQWRQIFKDWTGPIAPDKGVMNNFSLTGRGIGSFRFVYHNQHPNIGTPNRFHQAHNDYLELGYSLGYIGEFLFIGALIYMFSKNVSMREVFMYGESRYIRALSACLVTVLVGSVGSFLFQIGTFAFFCPVIAGLLSNNFHREKFDEDTLCPYF